MEHNTENRNSSANREGSGGERTPKIMMAIAAALLIALIAFVSGYLGVKLAIGTAANQIEKQAAASEPASMQSVLLDIPAEAPEPTPMQSVLTDVSAETPKPTPMQSVLPDASEGIPGSAPMQSFFSLPSPAATPDPEYLNQLRQNAVVVNTEKEFTDALNTAYVIVLNKDITLSDNFISLENINALLIDEGVTLTVTSPNFHPGCAIVNLGEIIVDGEGRMIFFSEPDYSLIGKISVKGRDARICFNTGKIGADEIACFLSDDSLFNQLSIVAGSSDDKLVDILVDHDITIPAGKILWINIRSVLHVPEGVTLTNNGAIRYYNKPVIEGKIDRTGKELYD